MRTRRFKKSRVPHKVFLVICEGETEAAYIGMLKKFYRVPITIRTKISGNAITARLVKQYMTELGIGDEDECRVFYVYDADVACVVERLQSLTGTLILSNPCIELWFILHSSSSRRSMTSQEAVRQLKSCHPVWRNYGKGSLTVEQQKHLSAHSGEAMTRAASLKWPENPSSNLREFLKALELEKPI